MAFIKKVPPLKEKHQAMPTSTKESQKPKKSWLVKPIITHKLEGGLEAIEKSLDMMKNKPEGLIKPAVKLTW